MRIMWVDPGGRTGVAWCDISAPTRAAVVGSWIDGSGGCSEEFGPTENHNAWNVFVRASKFNPDVFGFEDFRLFPNQVTHDMSGTIPMRIQARLEMLFWLAGTSFGEMGIAGVAGPFQPRLEYQMPHERLDIGVDELRRLKLWRTKGQGGGKDAMAATQHLLHYVKVLNVSGRWKELTGAR